MTDTTAPELTPGQRRTAAAIRARRQKAADIRHAKWIRELEEWGYTVTRSDGAPVRLEM